MTEPKEPTMVIKRICEFIVEHKARGHRDATRLWRIHYGDLLSWLISYIVGTHNLVPWGGFTFDGIAYSAHKVESNHMLDVFAMFYTMADAEGSKIPLHIAQYDWQVPVHILIQSIPQGISYQLEMDRVLKTPKSKSKIENDLYLLARGELYDEWEWVHSVKGEM